VTDINKKKTKSRGADPSQTCAKILKAARQLFVENGLNGTSMRAIAKTADVTQSLIHHHFGSKEALWQKVKADLLSQYFSEIEQQISQENQGDKAGSLENVLENRFRFMQANPDIVRIALWQRLDNYPGHSTGQGQSLLKHLLKDLELSQQRGELRQDISASMMTVVLFALSAGWFQQNYSWILELDPAHSLGSSDEAAEAYLDAIKKIFLEGVLAPKKI